MTESTTMVVEIPAMVDKVPMRDGGRSSFET